MGLCAITAEGLAAILGRGTKILRVAWCSQKQKKRKQTALPRLQVVRRLRIDMHFSASKFSVLSHWVAKTLGLSTGRFWSLCRQGLIHRALGL